MFCSRYKLSAFRTFSCSNSFFKNTRKLYEQHVSYVREKNLKSFFDISIENKIKGRITFELFTQDLPRTTLNFYHLCKGDKVAKDGKALSYKSSLFHRVIPGFMCQGGDIVSNNGTGSLSIYGKKFGDENFMYSHNEAGLLSMANRGPNTNGSQFFITTADCGWLDGKHVVFGKILDGIDILNSIEAVGTATGKPKSEIVISNCGVLE